MIATDDAPMTAEEQRAFERRQKVASLNDALRSRGLWPTHGLVGDEVSDEQLASAQRAIARYDAPPGDSAFASTAAPQGFLGKLGAAVSAKWAQAMKVKEDAEAQARAAVDAAEVLQGKFEALQSRLKTERLHLAWARKTHDSHVAALAQISTVEASLAAYEPTRPPNDDQWSRIVDHYEARRWLKDALDDWPQVEKGLLARIRATETELHRIEKEFG